eukprot:6305666-Prymnesium_polylepis.1
MTRAMLRRLDAFRDAGAPGMAGLRVLRASSAGLQVATRDPRASRALASHVHTAAAARRIRCLRSLNPRGCTA